MIDFNKLLLFLFLLLGFVLSGCSSNSDVDASVYFDSRFERFVETSQNIDNDKVIALLSDKTTIQLDSEIRSGTLEN